MHRGRRETGLATARKLLPDWPEEAFAIRELPESQGPGNILLLEARFEQKLLLERVTDLHRGPIFARFFRQFPRRESRAR